MLSLLTVNSNSMVLHHKLELSTLQDGLLAPMARLLLVVLPPSTSACLVASTTSTTNLLALNATRSPSKFRLALLVVPVLLQVVLALSQTDSQLEPDKVLQRLRSRMARFRLEPVCITLHYYFSCSITAPIPTVEPAITKTRLISFFVGKPVISQINDGQVQAPTATGKISI